MYRKVVVGLVLNNRVIPAIADHHTAQLDLLGSRLEMGVLLLDVLVEDGPVVAAITLRGEVEGFARVLRKCAHKTL